MRTLLNALPDWALIPIFVIVAVGITLAGLAVVRILIPSWRDEASSQVVLAATAIVMTFFALLLALVIVDLYTSYKDASADVTAEANTLDKIVQDSSAFPQPQQQSVKRAVGEYVVEVRDHEFPALKDGQQDPRMDAKLAEISAALQSYQPVSQTQISFYNSATSQVNDLVSERHTRVSGAESSVPGALLALLLVLAVVTLATTIFLKTHNAGLDFTLIVSISVIVGLGLATVLILQYPYSGSIAVSSDPLTEGALGQVAHLAQ